MTEPKAYKSKQKVAVVQWFLKKKRVYDMLGPAKFATDRRGLGERVGGRDWGESEGGDRLPARAMCSACTLLVCQLVFMAVCVGWGLGDGCGVKNKSILILMCALWFSYYY